MVYGFRVPNQIVITQDFSVPPEQVFAALNDHLNMGRWLGGKITVHRAVPDGGVGTVRRVHLGPAHFDEEVIECEAPSRIVYRIVGAVPLLKHHRGELIVQTAGAGSRVQWTVALDVNLPGASGLLRAGLGQVLKQGLKRLSRQLDKKRG